MARKSKSKSNTERKQKARPAYEGADIDGILECLEEGSSVREACELFKVKKSSFMRWVLEDIGGLADRYYNAQEIGAYVRADEIVEIADDGRNDWVERKTRSGSYMQLNGEHIRRSEIRIAQRQWHLQQVRNGGYRRRREGGDDLGDIANALAALANLAAVKQASP